MLRTSGWVGMVALALGMAGTAEGKPSIKLASTPAPKELKEPFRKQLVDRSIQLFDDKGGSVAEFWFRKELPVKATGEQVKNGLTYREVEETTWVGVVRFDQLFIDYRKQKIKPGVYTLRLGFQPMDGDHMGTAPYQEFCLLIPAANDEKSDVLEVKEMRELSNKAPAANHPGVLLLFPNEKPEDMPKLEDKGMGHWVLAWKQDAAAGGSKASLGMALTVVGHTAAE